MSKPKCAKLVRDHTGFHQFQCRNTGKVEFEGTWYCGVHDPVRRAKKHAEAAAVWKAKMDADQMARARRRAEQEALTGLDPVKVRALIDEMSQEECDWEPCKGLRAEERCFICRARDCKEGE